MFPRKITQAKIYFNHLGGDTPFKAFKIIEGAFSRAGDLLLHTSLWCRDIFLSDRCHFSLKAETEQTMCGF